MTKCFNVHLSSEVWCIIAEKVAQEDWKPVWTALPLVCKSSYVGSVRYLEGHVLPILKKVGKVEEGVSILRKCQSLQRELEKDISISTRHWKRPLHLTIEKVLKNGRDENAWRTFQDLLAARADVNCFTSHRQTPLILICDSLSTLFNLRLERKDRLFLYARVVEMARDLLKQGADPNLEGFPSTPLGCLTMHHPFGEEDHELISSLMDLLKS